MTKLVPTAISKGESKGAPGLAFETWDPSSRFLLETPSLLFVIRSMRTREFFSSHGSDALYQGTTLVGP